MSRQGPTAVPPYLMKRCKQHLHHLENYGIDFILGCNGFIRSVNVRKPGIIWWKIKRINLNHRIANLIGDPGVLNNKKALTLHYRQGGTYVVLQMQFGFCLI